MSRPDLEPLDPDLVALLRAERERPREAPAVRARMLARVGATVGAIGGRGGGSSPGAAAPPAPPAAGAGPAGLGSGGLFLPILLGAGLGGVVATVFVVRPDSAPAPHLAAAPPEPSPPARAPAPSDPPAAPDPARTPPRSSFASPRASAAEPAVAGRDASLAAERLALDEAQRALAEGHGAAAMDALDRHTRDFPSGRLREEREALWIRALARAGRTAEARARAARFQELYPHSILLPTIESTVGTIP